MIKLLPLIGLPVIDTNSGKQVGKVKDIWFDEHWLLTGIILDYRRWMSHQLKAIRWQAVIACGEDAVLISDKQAVELLSPSEIARCFCTGQVKLREMPVVTTDGLQLGRVSDVYFDHIKGTPIVGYELTDGFISDLREGRKWLRISDYPDEVTLGEDAILVPIRAEQDLKHTALPESEIREK